MLDNPGFLAAILENPEDDTPRLVYADWLEENGQPERAEFIRVQIEKARLPHQSDRWLPLHRRANDLERQHGKTWLENLPKAARWHCRPRFERGFVAVLSCTVNQFLKVASGVVRVTPLRKLEVAHHGAPERWEDLARCRHLTRLGELELTSSDILDPGVIALASCPYLANLSRLLFWGNGLTNATAQALISSPYLRNLEMLTLISDSIGESSKQAMRDHFGERVRFD